MHAQANDNHPGSATLVIVSLDPDAPVLKAAYVGDSGYAIFRVDPEGNVQLVNKFKEQLHGFNFPFQLARPDLDQGDSPDVAIIADLEVQTHDILIVGSDGLFDNIHIEEIQQEIQARVGRNSTKLTAKKELAELLAARAIAYGHNTTHESPFAAHAR